MSTTGIAGSFGRMSRREKLLVTSLVGTVLFLGIGGGFWMYSRKIHSKEEQIRKNRRDWAEVQKLSVDYQRTKKQAADLKERIKTNPDAAAPELPIAQASTRAKVHYRATNTATEDEKGTWNKVLQPTGDLQQKPLGTKRRNAKGAQFFRVEKDFTMPRGAAKVDDVFSFLSDIEALSNLVFVTRLNITRWTNDPDYLWVKNMTVATLRWEAESGDKP